MGKIDVRDGTLECVDEFYYLGDMIGVEKDVEASSIMRVRCGWKKFRVATIADNEGTLPPLEGKLVYCLCEKCNVAWQ